MPRAKNPITELEAHREKQAALAKKAKQLENDVAVHLGRQMMAAKLHLWEPSALKEVIERMVALGQDAVVSRLASEAAVPSRASPSPELVVTDAAAQKT